MSNSQGIITIDNRSVMVDSFPMGIDYDKYAEAAASPEALEREVHYRISLGEQKLILSIDRLDYSKGHSPAPGSLRDVLRPLPRVPQQGIAHHGGGALRDQVGQYKELKEDIEGLVGRTTASTARSTGRPFTSFTAPSRWKSFRPSTAWPTWRWSPLCATG